MTIDPRRVKVGDQLYDSHKELMGNTTIRRMGSWSVRILEIWTSPHNVLMFKASWNGNTPRTWSAGQVAKLRRTPAMRRPSGFSSYRHECKVCKTTEGIMECSCCGQITCKTHRKEDSCF